ncbi:MAG: S24/S26 family peptidase [Candidatus Electronema sp. V4]|uniref:S24/S26 family peptidase n=1 Tax=Candidatus Electronema sp. V4 TaxID=3454756 RepID=UPI0040557432
MSRPAAAPIIGIREPGAFDLVQTLLRQGVMVRIRVSGDSMRPLLQGGELVEVAPLGQAIPSLGDILFVRSRQDAPIIHRLIWQRRQNGRRQLLTKGDACPGFDGFIPVEQVLGRVDRVLISDQHSTSLRAPAMRLRAALVVSRALLAHALRKLRAWSRRKKCSLSRSVQ